MSPPLRIAVVLGSVRPNRRSQAPAQLLVERVVSAGHHADLLDLRELDLPMYGHEQHHNQHAAVLSFKETLAGADAAVWLTPEYNHSFTSAVKNAIDFLGGELKRKPSAVCGLSSGPMGGVRAVEQLRLVLIEQSSVPIRDAVYFTDAEHLFDAEGHLTRPEYHHRVDQMIVELAWYAAALRHGRIDHTIERER